MENKKRKLPIWAKILVATGGVCVLLLAIFLLVDTRPFSDYKLFLSRTINSIVNDKERHDTVDGRVVESEDFGEMDKKLPFKVSKPMWLPEGYTLEYADYSDFGNNIYSVTYTYKNSTDETKCISFSFATDPGLDPLTGITVEIEKVEVNGMDIYLSEFDDGESSMVLFINEQGFQASISGDVNKETLIKIVENMS